MDGRGKKKALLIKTVATFRSLLLCFCIVFVGHIRSLNGARVPGNQRISEKMSFWSVGRVNQDYK